MITSSAWQKLSSGNAVFPIDMEMQVGSGSAQCSEAGPTLPARGRAPGRAAVAHAQDAAPGAHVDGAAPGAACAHGCGALSPQCRLDRVPQALLAVYLQSYFRHSDHTCIERHMHNNLCFRGLPQARQQCTTCVQRQQER